MMGKKVKKRKYDPNKLAAAARRDAEIEKYGKLLSLRPGSEMKSKKDYTRNKKVKPEDYEEE